MDKASVMVRLQGIFRAVFDDPAIVLTPETTADDIPQWDSMNHIMIVVEAERQFGLKFQTAEIEELRNVGDFVMLILDKQIKS